MAFFYTAHARLRMRARRVDVGDVVAVITEPDAVHLGDHGELIASRRIGRRQLQVVYDTMGDDILVITVMV